MAGIRRPPPPAEKSTESTSSSERTSPRSTPPLLCVSPDPAELQAALDKKRWRVHGENYEKVEERLRKACLNVGDTLSQLIGAMRDLELWQATAAKTCELPTNSLAKITVITSKMIRSRSVLTSQLGSLQDVCRCFFPSTMLLEITGQRELQARAEVEIEKWAQLAFNGQQAARQEFKTLHAALRWYRLANRLTGRFDKDLHLMRIRKLRARIGGLERRVRSLKGQLTWEKKRADRAFGALHINRKLARGLAPSDFETLPQEARKTGKTTRGWASARGVDTKAPKGKGFLSARSDGVKRNDLTAIAQRPRESAVMREDDDFDKENDPQPVTKDDFASAVASLAARIREATGGRMGVTEPTAPLAGIAGSLDAKEPAKQVPGSEGVAQPTELPTTVTRPADEVLPGSEDVMRIAESLGGKDLETSQPAFSEPTRSPSPVLGTTKQGVFIPSLNLGEMKQILEEESSSESTLSNHSKTGLDSSTSTGSKLILLSTDSLLTQSLPAALVSPEKPHGEGKASEDKLPRLILPERVDSQKDRVGGFPALNGAANKVPPLNHSQSPPLSLPFLPSEPLSHAGSATSRSEGAALTERLARALGVEYTPRQSDLNSGNDRKEATPKTGLSKESDKHEKGSEQLGSLLSSDVKEKRETTNGQFEGRTHASPSTALDAGSRGLNTRSTAPERPGSLTERGTASTSAPSRGEESRENYSKREVLSLKIEQGRQMQHLQTLYEERIQGLHDFYEKLLSQPDVLAQLAESSLSASRPATSSTRGASTNRGATSSFDPPQRNPEVDGRTSGSIPRQSTPRAKTLLAASLDIPRKASVWKQATQNVRRATIKN